MVDGKLCGAAIVPAAGDEAAVDRLLSAEQPDAPRFWEPGNSETITVPVDGAEIRVYHTRPDRPVGRRPIVFVPGWGTNPQGWFDFYRAVHGRAEMYYLETREKASSRILDRRTDMGVGQAARDIARALDVPSALAGGISCCGRLLGRGAGAEGHDRRRPRGAHGPGAGPHAPPVVLPVDPALGLPARADCPCCTCCVRSSPPRCSAT